MSTPNHSASAAPTASARSNTARLLGLVLALGLIIAIPVGIAGGISWLDWAGSWSGAGRPQPKWVTSGEVRASTRDGTLVKVRVAFDVGSGSTKSAVETHLRDVALLLEVSIGAQSANDLAGAQGIQRLSRDMLARVNDYLASQGVEPMRGVAIQDLWYTRP